MHITLKRKYIWTLTVFIIGAVFSAYMCYVASDSLNVKEKAEFQFRANDHFSHTLDDFYVDIYILEAYRAFYSSSIEVEPHEFTSFVAPLLKNHPGIQMVGWAPVINSGDLTHFLNSVRNQHNSDYKIWHNPLERNDITKSVDSKYCPILYVEPRDQRNELLGFDLYSNIDFIKPIERSYTDSTFLDSDLCRLALEKEDKSTIALALQVDKIRDTVTGAATNETNISGYTIGIFALTEYFKRRAQFLDRDKIELIVRDISDNNAGEVIYSHISKHHGKSDEGYFNSIESSEDLNSYDKTIDLFGKKLLFSYFPISNYLSGNSHGAPLLVLFTGLLFTCLLSVLVLLIFRQMDRLHKYSSNLTIVKQSLEIDIEKREQVELELRENKRNLSTLISNLPGMVYKCKNDNHWTMEFLSNGCKQITGYSTTELIDNESLSYNDLINPEDRPFVWEQVQFALQIKNSFQIVYRITNRDGQIKWLWEQGRGVYNKDGAIIAIEGYISDITEQKQIEKQLRETERLRSVGEAAASIIHDIKNPMQVVLSSVELLKRNTSRAGVNCKYCKVIETQVNRMLSMSQEILDYSKGDLKLNTSKVNLQHFCDEIVDTYKESYQESQLALSGKTTCQNGASPVIIMDKERIWRVIMNLMNNAKEAMPDGGLIELKITIDSDKVEFVVQDDGPGIPEDIKDNLFEPFVTRGKSSGTGLGLSIAKRIIEAHGGEISVMATNRNGTSFIITLPSTKDETHPVSPTLQKQKI